MKSLHASTDLCSEPDDVEKLLANGKDGQILSLLQQSFLLCELAAGFILLLHVIGKLLLRSEIKLLKCHHY